MRKFNVKVVSLFLLGYLVIAGGVISSVSSKAQTGMVTGKCSTLIKDFQYVNGISTCPILTAGKEKLEMLSPSALPNVISSKVKYLNLNGVKDISVVYYLSAPMLLITAFLPLLLMITVFEKKGLLAITPKIAGFRNLILIVIYYFGFTSIFTVYNFYYSLGK